MSCPLSDIFQARVAAGTLRPDPAQLAVLDRLDGLRVWLEDHPDRQKAGLRSLFSRPATPPPGLYIWGGVGRGKSMLMDLFHQTVAIPAKRRVHFHAFMQEAHRAMHQARKTGTEDALAPFAAQVAEEVRLLCFDEMQISDITDAMVVGRLFEMLLADGVLIVVTSNRPPEDLYKDGLGREAFLPFIALLRERLTVAELESPTDYRRHRLQGAQVYFTPAGRTATQAIDAIWADLTGDAARTPLRLPLNGREVEVPAFANGVGRATFWDLCARPLGPADFLAIAGALRVLILEDIPQLSAANYNEAKRFVTLIDTLYEARVRLICTAAEVPERLYLEGTGSFEFERTVSRLREMQAADWASDG